MIQKTIDQITKEDIDSLVATKTPESRTLEYKQELHADKREFLYDVSAFANTAGGDIVFGIAEERDANGKPTGLPVPAYGIALPNVSQVIASFENSLRDGVDPRIPGVQWQQIDGFQKGPVLVYASLKVGLAHIW